MANFTISCVMTPYLGAARTRCWAADFVGTRAEADHYAASLAAEAAADIYPEWQAPSTDFQVEESAAPAPLSPRAAWDRAYDRRVAAEAAQARGAVLAVDDDIHDED